MRTLTLSLALALTAATAVRADEPPKSAPPAAIKVATFDVDATPPLVLCHR